MQCRDTQISQHGCKESGKADLEEALVGVPTSKRPQINYAQYPRIPGKVLTMKRLSMMKLGTMMLILNVWSVETLRYLA
jgi:hypothetical protein